MIVILSTRGVTSWLKTAVLGCYANREISIFNVTDQRLDGIREVTAAHEMLHAQRMIV